MIFFPLWRSFRLNPEKAEVILECSCPCSTDIVHLYLIHLHCSTTVIFFKTVFLTGMFPLCFSSHFPLYLLFLSSALEPLWNCESICSAGLKSFWLLLCHLMVPLEPWWQMATFSVLWRPLCLLPVAWKAPGWSSQVRCGAVPFAPLAPAKVGGGSMRKGSPTNLLCCVWHAAGLYVRPLNWREQWL